MVFYILMWDSGCIYFTAIGGILIQIQIIFDGKGHLTWQKETIRDRWSTFFSGHLTLLVACSSQLLPGQSLNKWLFILLLE